MSLSNYSYSYCSSTQYSWCERNDCTTTNYGGTYTLWLYNCHGFNFGIDWNQTTRWYFNTKVVVEEWLWLVTNQAGGDHFADWWDDVGSQNYDNTQIWRSHNYGDLLMSTFISWFTPESMMLMFVAGARRRAEGTVGEVGSGTGWEHCMKHKNNMWTIVAIVKKTFAKYSCKLVLISSNQITDHF